MQCVVESVVAGRDGCGDAVQESLCGQPDRSKDLNGLCLVMDGIVVLVQRNLD